MLWRPELGLRACRVHALGPKLKSEADGRVVEAPWEQNRRGNMVDCNRFLLITVFQPRPAGQVTERTEREKTKDNLNQNIETAFSDIYPKTPTHPKSEIIHRHQTPSSYS
jgi:hypothetical protein